MDLEIEKNNKNLVFLLNMFFSIRLIPLKQVGLFAFLHNAVKKRFNDNVSCRHTCCYIKLFYIILCPDTIIIS